MQIKDLVTGIQHIGVPTNDIEKTIDFYSRLGFEVAFRTPEEPGKDKVAFLCFKNVTIETYQNGRACMKSGAIDHIALDVTDIDKAFQVISAGGFTMLDREVQSLPFWENGVKFFNILGPNSEIIEFSQKL